MKIVVATVKFIRVKKGKTPNPTQTIGGYFTKKKPARQFMEHMLRTSWRATMEEMLPGRTIRDLPEDLHGYALFQWAKQEVGNKGVLVSCVAKKVEVLKKW